MLRVNNANYLEYLKLKIHKFKASFVFSYLNYLCGIIHAVSTAPSSPIDTYLM